MAIMVDCTKRGAYADWCERYRVQYLPTMILVKPDGTEIDRQLPRNGAALAQQLRSAWTSTSAPAPGGAAAGAPASTPSSGSGGGGMLVLVIAGVVVFLIVMGVTLRVVYPEWFVQEKPDAAA